MTDLNRIYLDLGPFKQVGAGFQNQTIDSLTSIDRIAWVFFAPKTMTITHLGFRYVTRASGTTPVQHKIGLQTPDASGNPDGTWKGGGSPATGLFTPPASTAWDGTFQWVALDNALAVTGGDPLAMVLEPVGNPATGPNTCTFTRSFAADNTALGGAHLGSYHLIQVDGGAWGKQSSQSPVFGIANSDPVSGSPTIVAGLPIKDITNRNINSAAEDGLYFTLPGFCAAYKLVGVRAGLGWAAGGQTITMTLWTDAATPVSLQAKAFDSDHVGAIGNWNQLEYYFETPVWLRPGTPYIIGFAPTGAGTHMRLLYVEVQNANDMLAFGLGTFAKWAERSSGGATAFTTSALKRPVMALILDEIAGNPRGGYNLGI